MRKSYPDLGVKEIIKPPIDLSLCHIQNHIKRDKCYKKGCIYFPNKVCVPYLKPHKKRRKKWGKVSTKEKRYGVE